jgi:hypothetical protein
MSLGELLIAGYLDRTRAFMRLVPANPLDPPHDNSILWYLGPEAPLDPGFLTFDVNAGAPPVYAGLATHSIGDPNAEVSELPLWFSGEDRYDASADAFVFPTPVFAGLIAGYPVTASDITPHLLPDIHPYWIGASTPGNPVGPSLFTWGDCPSLADPLNFALYLAATAGRINPPGAYPRGYPDFVWIDSPTTFLGHEDSVGPVGPGLGQTDSWGRFVVLTAGGAGGSLFETLPATEVDGALVTPQLPNLTGAAGSFRYTLEFGPRGRPFDGPSSNIQTFQTRISK